MTRLDGDSCTAANGVPTVVDDSSTVNESPSRRLIYSPQWVADARVAIYWEHSIRRLLLTVYDRWRLGRLLLAVHDSPRWLLAVHDSPRWLLAVHDSPRWRSSTASSRRLSRLDGGSRRPSRHRRWVAYSQYMTRHVLWWHHSLLTVHVVWVVNGVAKDTTRSTYCELWMASSTTHSRWE